MTTLNDLYKYFKNNNKHLIPPTNHNFLEKYYDNSAKYDRFISFLFGSRVFIQEEDGMDFDEVGDMWHELVVAYINTNAHNLKFLYDGINAEYNPLNNYDKNSTITTTMNGKEINTNTPSGIETETTTIGNGKVTNTSQISPNENDEFYNAAKNISENDEQMNLVERSFEDRNTTDTREFENRNDVVVEHTSGNIGTTTSIDMLEQEQSFRMRSFLLDLMEKMVKTITY